MTGDIAGNYRRVRAAIDAAALASGRRADDVRLLPVTKTRPVAEIEQIIALAGNRVGENKVQEMAAKAADLAMAVEWVLIGHLQRNKARQAARVMTELQSLDSLRLAEALERYFEESSATTRLPVLVEVNTSGEAAKWGVAPGDVASFTAGLAAFPHLEPRGLMTVAHPDPGRAEAGFRALAGLRDRLRDRDGGGWDELSMGMSGDFGAAIRHGSTCVRIGTALFGPRITPA